METQSQLPPPPPPPPHDHPNTVAEPLSPLPDLVAALEHAAQTAKQLSTSSPSHLFASLCNAYLQIASFLDRYQSVEGEEEEDDPMADEDSSTSRAIEEGLRNCALRRTKRCKRPLSPSLPEEEGSRELSSYDPTQRQRSLDLIFQFHG